MAKNKNCGLLYKKAFGYLIAFDQLLLKKQLCSWIWKYSFTDYKT